MGFRVVLMIIARLLDPHRPSRLHAQQCGHRLDVPQVQLAAEAASYVRGLHHPDHALRQIEHESKLLAHAEQMLRRRIHRQAAVDVALDDADTRLHIAGVRALRLVGPFEDMVRLLEAGLDIAELEYRILGDVPLAVFVQLRRTVLHGRFRIEDGFQFLVVDVDQLQRLFGDLGGRCRHGRNRLAGIPHRIAEDQHVLDHAGRHGWHEVDGAELLLWHILREQHSLDAGQCARPGRIDAEDSRMGIGTSQQPPMKHPWQRDIHRKALPAPHLFKGIGPQRALANDGGFHHVVPAPVHAVSGPRPRP